MKLLLLSVVALVFCAAVQAAAQAQEGGRTGGEQTEEKVYKPGEVDKRAKITDIPTPEMTDEARRHSFHGEVLLTAVLAADGLVTHITVIRGAPYGMTEECVKATRGSKFEPAIKDGRAVSQHATFSYNFNLY